MFLCLFRNLLVFSVQISSFLAIKVVRLHFFGPSTDKADGGRRWVKKSGEDEWERGG